MNIKQVFFTTLGFLFILFLITISLIGFGTLIGGDVEPVRIGGMVGDLPGSMTEEEYDSLIDKCEYAFIEVNNETRMIKRVYS